MSVETGRVGHRLRAYTDTVVEFTPEPTGEQLRFVNLVVCSASPALTATRVRHILNAESGWYHGNFSLSSLFVWDVGRF